MVELDIIILNCSHFKGKDGKIYNTINYAIVNKDSYIETEKFKGYSVATSFVNQNKLDEIKPLDIYIGKFENNISGLKSTLKLIQIQNKKSSEVIDLL